MYDWDDLRVFLAAARSGSLTRAAQKLSIDAATVGRRLSRLETALRSTLLVRSTTGLKLTASGGRLLEAAIDAERAMETVARVGRRDTISGTVRLSVAEGFGTMLVAPALPALRAARPQLRVELAAQTGFLSPSKREVDIAVTLAAPSSTRVVVEPLTDHELALTFDNYYAGFTLPILECASGKLFMAYADAEERRSILQAIRMTPEDVNPRTLALAESSVIYNDVLENGYATQGRNRFTATPGKTSSISVPILSQGKITAAVTLVFFAKAMKIEDAVTAYLDDLKQTAAAITRAFHTDRQAPSRPVSENATM